MPVGVRDYRKLHEQVVVIYNCAFEEGVSKFVKNGIKRGVYADVKHWKVMHSFSY